MTARTPVAGRVTLKVERRRGTPRRSLWAGDITAGSRRPTLDPRRLRLPDGVYEVVAALRPADGGPAMEQRRRLIVDRTLARWRSDPRAAGPTPACGSASPSPAGPGSRCWCATTRAAWSPRRRATARPAPAACRSPGSVAMPVGRWRHAHRAGHRQRGARHLGTAAQRGAAPLGTSVPGRRQAGDPSRVITPRRPPSGPRPRASHARRGRSHRRGLSRPPAGGTPTCRVPRPAR